MLPGMYRAFAVLLLAACGAHAGDAADALRGLPPRHDPPIDLQDEDDLGRARGAYDAIPLGDPSRSPKRRELWAAYRARIDRALPDSREQALDWFQKALGMWDARELGDAKVPPGDVDLLGPTAESLYRQFSSSGSDVEAATALVVLLAARPERAAEYEKTWAEIETYVDGLATAEDGPGAQGSRPIVVLEKVMATFPSRWATDRLLALYHSRQDRLQKYITAKGQSESLLRAAFKDRGAARPVWNLVRAYARSWRLPEAKDAVAKVAGQFGDEPELRKRLDAALVATDGQDWLALTSAFIPSDQLPEADYAAAMAICTYGADKLPKDPQTRKCAAEIARRTDRLALGIRWIDDARRLAPDDRDADNFAGVLYIAEMGDLLQAERLDAAAARMKAIQAFYKDMDARFPGKPLERTYADACLVYGRGLFNQGDVIQATTYLKQAQTLGRPRAGEELATIAYKTGRFADAAAEYEAQAALPRDTPIETTFEGARLRRLAGEAWRAAGNTAKAQELWKHALGQWNDVLGASLQPRARAEAFTESGRVHWALGETKEAVAALAQAVDADPEETGVYSDVISFLVTRGAYDEALDAFHRALGRDEVTDYMKVYSSVWMVDLARMKGIAPDALAERYLASASKGTRWFHQLARWKSGKATYADTLALADTRGKRAEAYFYEATNRYAAGDRAGADELLHKVIATQMLGFFEYDMATWYLEHGPPKR
jgi:tetratricopeptide (TPR) repeat protein